MKRAAVALASLAMAALAAFGLSGGSASAANPVPLPAALQSGAVFATQKPPSTLVSSPWTAAANEPGQCKSNPSQIFVNSAGFAQINTNGKFGNCAPVESPHTYPTKPGYIYEARVNASTLLNWDAFWQFGSNWPDQGEIDAFEPQFGTNYVSWHFASCGQGAASSTKSTDPFTYPCKTTVKPAGANIGTGWHTIDIAYQASSVQVYYDGHLYATMPETLTASTSDPMWIVFGASNCAQPQANTCAPGGDGKAGNLQVAWLRIWT